MNNNNQTEEKWNEALITHGFNIYHFKSAPSVILKEVHADALLSFILTEIETAYQRGLAEETDIEESGYMKALRAQYEAEIETARKEAFAEGAASTVYRGMDADMEKIRKEERERVCDLITREFNGYAGTLGFTAKDLKALLTNKQQKEIELVKDYLVKPRDFINFPFPNPQFNFSNYGSDELLITVKVLTNKE